jgi:hypothetical protein
MEDSQRIALAKRTMLQAATRAILVAVECFAAGWAVGTAAHFLGGSPGFGLDLGAFQLAFFEGGIQGAAIGMIVGLVIFYGMLQGRATWKDWAILVGVSLVTAAIMFLLLGVITLLVTPVVTLIVAFALGISRSSRRLA